MSRQSQSSTFDHIKKLFRYLHNSSASELAPLSRDEYRKRLTNDPKKLERAFEKAWDARKFEIDLYWKRASYYWAFIAATFAAYVTLSNSPQYKSTDQSAHSEVFVVVCVGLVLSCAFWFINIGSKSWQRHWEIHIDLLEDPLIGGLYKTSTTEKSFSVTKINDIISVLFVSSWVLLGCKYLSDQNLFNLHGRPNPVVISAGLISSILIWAMIFGHGRGRFGNRPVQVFARKFNYEEEADDIVDTTNSANESSQLKSQEFPVRTSLKLRNLHDIWSAKKCNFEIERLRSVKVPNALVNDEVDMLCLPSCLIEELGLEHVSTRMKRTSIGMMELKVYGMVLAEVEDRTCCMEVAEVPEIETPIIGHVPLTLLDLVIDKQNCRLIGNPDHGGKHMIDMF